MLDFKEKVPRRRKNVRVTIKVTFIMKKDEHELEYELHGKTWKVYLLLLKSGREMSVREVQKALHLSTPSLAEYHLERLRDLGLVQKQDVGGRYFLVNEVKIGVVRHFVKLGRLLFPRYFFYAVFSTTLYVVYLTFIMQGFSQESLFITVFWAIISGMLWYEAYRIWSLRPF